MRRVIALLVVTMFLGSLAGYGADFGFFYRAKTGDKELDVTLGDLNTCAKADREGFISNLSLSYGIPRTEIENMFKMKMKPADVYMAVRIGKLSGKPLPIVIGEYKVNRKRGWGVIAKNLGIKPGSPKFHALKKGATRALGKAKVKAKVKGRVKEKGKAKIRIEDKEKRGKGKGRGKWK